MKTTNSFPINLSQFCIRNERENRSFIIIMMEDKTMSRQWMESEERVEPRCADRRAENNTFDFQQSI